MTEMGCAWIPSVLKQLDSILENVRNSGAIGELRFTPDQVLPRSATEYFHQNCWVGASQPGPADAAVRSMMGDDRFMWGSDYPHDEGTYPYTREHLRQIFSDTPRDELQRILAGNAARLYGFDLDALAPLAATYGPAVEEIAQPLTELPENPNSALRRGLGQLL
jgi:predicted TIM-barrel fold metal-dependent hydrolase